MAKYIFKRILLLIPSMLLVATLVFAIARMVPGGMVNAILESNGKKITEERVEKMTQKLGLDDPLVVQYFKYIGGLITGDWGKSIENNQPVFQRMKAVWEPTLLITVYATVITVVLAIPIGIFSATHRNSLADYAINTVSVVVMSIPTFVLGLLLIYVFGYKLHLFPTTGYARIAKKGLWTSLRYLTLPSFALGLQNVATLARHTRSAMLDVLNEDYIRTARAKGLSRTRVYYKHALKNTLSIVATLIVGIIVELLSGAVIIEAVFNLRGMGSLLINSMTDRDFYQMQAIILLFAFVYLIIALLLDIFYKYLDPRIEYE